MFHKTKKNLFLDRTIKVFKAFVRLRVGQNANKLVRSGSEKWSKDYFQNPIKYRKTNKMIRFSRFFIMNYSNVYKREKNKFVNSLLNFGFYEWKKFPKKSKKSPCKMLSSRLSIKKSKKFSQFESAFSFFAYHWLIVRYQE